MAERASVFQGVQLGVETTPGTAVPANKKLGSLSIQPSIRSESSVFRPMGTKYATVVAQNREWIEASLEGQPTFDEMIYPLSSVLTTAAVTQPDSVGAPSAYLWTFDPKSSAADTPKTFTIEQGDAGRAHRFAYGIVSELGLEFSRSGIGLSGSMLGRRLQDGVTLTASPTSIPLIPILPTQVNVYMDNTAAGLGTTKLTRNFAANLSIGDRFNPVWPLDSSLNSFAATVEAEPTATLEMNMAVDSQWDGILTALRQGDTKFIRIEAVGGTIAAAVNYRFTIDLAGKVSDVGDFDDEDGVFVVPPTFEIVHDGGWGRALKVEVVNTRSAL